MWHLKVIPKFFNHEELMLVSERDLGCIKGNVTSRVDWISVCPTQSRGEGQLKLLLVVLCYQFFDVGQFVVEVFAAVLLLAVVGVCLFNFPVFL